MNRELYIHTLSQFRDECKRKHMDTETEAFNAAIQALSADGDCISRQAAIDAVRDRMGKGETNIGDTFIECFEMILNALPSAQPEPQWIPCSERLPEDGENVLVTYKTTDKIHPCQYHDDGSRNPWYSYIDQCRAHMNVVLAWMPLPEPWRGEEP